MALSNLSVYNISQTTASAKWSNSTGEDVNIRVTNPSDFGSYNKYECSIVNMLSNTYYTITVTGVISGSSVSSSFRTAAPAGQPPQGTTTISAEGKPGRKMRVSWNSISGATYYRLYKSSDGGVNYYPVTPGDGSVGNTLSYDAPVDYEWQYYRFQVTPMNSYGQGTNSYSGSFKSLDEVAPTVTSFYATQTLSNQITVYITGNDNNPSAGTPSGIYRFKMYQNGTHIGYADVNGPSNNTSQSQYFTFSSLTQNTQYTLTAYAEDYSGNLSSASTIYITTKSNRPMDFSWYTSKESGGVFNVTAQEWNDFTSKINAFRAYKSLSSYSFTTVKSGDVFYYWIFNQAVSAISEMNPPSGTLPSTQSQDSVIYASLFTNIVKALNSL